MNKLKEFAVQKGIASGIIHMIIAQFLFVSAWATIKSIDATFPLFEITFFRGIIAVLLLAPVMKIKYRGFSGKNTKVLFMRALFGFGGLTASFYAMRHMALGNSTTLFNTLPIFVSILAPFLLNERLNKLQLIFVIMAFIGVLFVIQPDQSMFSPIALISLSSGLLAATAMICVRKLKDTDPPIRITFYFTAFVCLASIPLMWPVFTIPTGMQLIKLIYIGISTTFGQVLMANAYRFGNAAIIAPFSYAAVIGSYVVGILLFSEIPNTYSIIGAVIVVLSGIFIMLSTKKLQRIPGSTPGMRA